MNIDFTQLGQFLLKLVKLPPLRLIVAILLIINGIQFYIKKQSDADNKEVIKELTLKVDNCRDMINNRDMFWMMRLDSVRIVHAEELRKRNEELEDLNSKQERINKLMEKAINNSKKQISHE